MPDMQMPGMPMPGTPASGHGMQMNAAGMYMMNEASGTSHNPASWPMPMLMPRVGSWNTMLMGGLFAVDTQQSGPRGGDKFFSTSMFMADAEHGLAGGSFMLDSMFSLEPALITERRYPELFQTGETAFGKAIVDGQHPHNFVMALGVMYAHKAGSVMMEVYAAPVGDPAIGPVAYAHRASAAELPQAPLGHHWQDSTHISYDVVTVSAQRGDFRLEASGFHGAEPDENRWTIGYGAIDSWSSRLSWMPTRNWNAQFSAGRLTHPESTDPGDQIRTTASVAYTRPIRRSAWSSSAIWGRNHNTSTQRNLNSYLLESVAPIGARNFVTGRFELVDKDELLPSGAVFRIGAYTAGYTRDIPSPFRLVETGVGANVTFYSTPSAIKPYYGQHPMGASMFLRFRLKPAEKN